MKKWPKVSVITTVYNTEKYIEKCLDSICNQSYKDLQIIVVNDASKGNVSEIVEKYVEEDSRIKYIDLEKNVGLFHARKKGAEFANGEYICFVDSDDYLGVDYIRSMVKAAIDQDADIVKTRFVLTDGNKCYVQSYVYNQPDTVLKNEEILNAYFEQEGLDYTWHTVWNKLYKKKLWDKCVPYYERLTKHLIMAEDFAYSTPLFTFAKKMVSISTDEYFYLQRAEASTGIVKDKNKYQKNINDLKTAFDFVENFLVETKQDAKNVEKFKQWRKRYSRFWFDNIERVGFSLQDKLELRHVLKQALKQQELEASVENDNYFYSCTMAWDKRLQEAKQKICSPETKVVSFDIFDTLLQRPFFKPTDLFMVVEMENKELMPVSNYHFAILRVKAEEEARKHSDKEEITLEEIYDVLHEEYALSIESAERLMEAEKAAEIKFCYPRNCAKELFELASFMGKRIVITSDMYLNKDVLEIILEKNGYIGFERLFLSSEQKKTKATGSLYKYLIQELNVEPEEIVHIGDNWESDIVKTKNLRIRNVFFPKTIERFQNCLEFGGLVAGNSFGFVKESWNAIRNNSCSLDFFGIRCMYAVIANDYFDNPYRSFNFNSDFNSDVYYMGLYALGMHLYGIANELIKNYGERRKIHFVSRDGYLCKQVYDILADNLDVKAKSNYLYLSRKALLPTAYRKPVDFYNIEEEMAEESIVVQTPEKILRNFLHMELTYDVEKELRNRSINGKEKFEDKKQFHKFLKVLGELECVKKYLEEYRGVALKYFADVMEQDVLFDIGYNGTAQYLLSNLLSKKIDAYYVYINKDKAMKYAKEMNYKVDTFYDSTPGISGCIREFFFSECAPSCVGYSNKSSIIEPVYENKIISYVEKNIADNIQLGVERFANLMVNHFGDMTKELYIRNYDCSIAFEYLMHKAKDLDRWAFHCCIFEDDVYYAGSKSLYKLWNDAVRYYFSPVYEREGTDKNAEQNGWSEISKDEVVVAVFRKINRWFPYGSKRRKAVRKVLRKAIIKK